MKRRLRNSVRALVLACATALTAACSSDASNPVSPASTTPAVAAAAAQDANQSGLLGNVVNSTVGGVLSGVSGLTSTLVNVLGRLVPLGHDITVSKVIGPNGGEISIQATGLQIIVPAGAVDSNVVFTVTALAGNAVAYEFAPHGVVFKQPLLFRQKLGLTRWLLGGTLGGGYFKDASQVDSEGRVATVDEQFTIQMEGGWATFKIWHFSGYLVSCARR